MKSKEVPEKFIDFSMHPTPSLLELDYFLYVFLTFEFQIAGSMAEEGRSLDDIIDAAKAAAHAMGKVK